MTASKNNTPWHDSQTIDSHGTDKAENATVTIPRDEYISLILGERTAEIRAEAAESATARLFTGRAEARRRAELAEQEAKRQSKNEFDAKVAAEFHREDAARLRKELRDTELRAEVAEIRAEEAERHSLRFRKELDQAKRRIKELEYTVPAVPGLPTSIDLNESLWGDIFKGTQN